MLKQEKGLKEAELENVSGGRESGDITGKGTGAAKRVISSVAAEARTSWSCPNCKSTEATVTNFDEGGSKIECSNCHYTVYM